MICGISDAQLVSTSDVAPPHRHRRRIGDHGRSAGEWRKDTHNFDKLAEEAPPGEAAKNSTAGTVGHIVSARDNAAPPAGRLGGSRVARLSLFGPKPQLFSAQRQFPTDAGRLRSLRSLRRAATDSTAQLAHGDRVPVKPVELVPSQAGGDS